MHTQKLETRVYTRKLCRGRDEARSRHEMLRARVLRDAGVHLDGLRLTLPQPVFWGVCDGFTRVSRLGTRVTSVSAVP